MVYVFVLLLQICCHETKVCGIDSGNVLLSLKRTSVLKTYFVQKIEASEYFVLKGAVYFILNLEAEQSFTSSG